MNHIEAQSLITAFIDNKLPSDKQEDFVTHMKNCPDCHKELEIYYTLLVGMRQIDNGEELCEDFDEDLDKNLDRLRGRSSGRRRVIMSTFTLIMIGLIGFMVFFYIQSLGRVYNYEQRSKAAMQGTTYFYRELGSILNTRNVLLNEVEVAPEQTEGEKFYQKIHTMNSVFNANDKLLSIGLSIDEKEVQNEKTASH